MTKIPWFEIQNADFSGGNSVEIVLADGGVISIGFFDEPDLDACVAGRILAIRVFGKGFDEIRISKVDDDLLAAKGL